MIKILNIINDNLSVNGGIPAVLFSHINNIDKKRFVYDVLIHTDKKFDEEKIIEDAGGKVIHFPYKYEISIKHPLASLISLNSYSRNLIKSIKENHYDIILIHCANCIRAFLVRALKKAKIGLIGSYSHNENVGRPLIVIFAKYLFKKYADMRIACSEVAFKAMYGKKRDNIKDIIFENAFDHEKFLYDETLRKTYREELCVNNEFIIGHIGRFCAQKNQLFLLDVFKDILDMNTESKLILVGDGEDHSKIQKRIEELGIEKSVRLLGIRNDVNKLLNAFDCFVFPSLFEGLGIAIVEAEVNGLPVYLSDNLNREVDINNRLNYISLKNSPKQWAQTIMANNNIRQKITIEEIREKGFCITDVIKKIQNFYISVLMRNNGDI